MAVTSPNGDGAVHIDRRAGRGLAPAAGRAPWFVALRARILLSVAVVLLMGFAAWSTGHLVHERSDALVAKAAERDAVVAAALSQARAVEDQADALTHLLVALALLSAVASGAYLYRSIVFPLRDLEAGAVRLATGDLSTRIPVRRPDEVGRLAMRFNEMAAELESRHARAIQAEKLAGVGRLAAGVAHEIRNPLTAILGYAKLMSKSADARVAADATLIVEEGERCQAIVAGLLDLSRPMRLSPVPVDLADVCAELATRLTESGAKNTVDLEVDGDATTLGDAGKLRQVVANLLRNACEASPDGPITVRIRRSEESLVLTVRDRGPGLGEHGKERLFEPFFTTKVGGTGLGLAVSSAIVRAHGGTLEGRDADGGGAVFELVIPLSGPAAELETVP